MLVRSEIPTIFLRGEACCVRSLLLLLRHHLNR